MQNDCDVAEGCKISKHLLVVVVLSQLPGPLNTPLAIPIKKEVVLPEDLWTEIT